MKLDALNLLVEIVNYVEKDSELSKEHILNEKLMNLSSINGQKMGDSSGDDDPLLHLQRYDKDILAAVALESSLGLRRAEQDVKQMRIDLQEAIKEQQELTGLKKKHKELQEAHLVQAKFIQKLQKDYSKVNLQSTLTVNDA